MNRVALVRAVVGFGLLAVLLAVLPYRLPGEVPDSSLRTIERPLCATCPASQQVASAGLRVDRGRPWLTVRFVAPPKDARVDVLIGESETPVTIEQRESGEWAMSVSNESGMALESFMVGERGDRAVFEMPAGASAGVALRSTDAVRFPTTGTLTPRPESPRGLNLIDLLVIVAMAIGAWRGYTHGARGMATQLIAVAVIVLLLKIVAPSPGAGMTGIAAAFGYGVVIALAGIGVHEFARRAAGPLVRGPVTGPVEPGLGLLLGMLRAGVIAALLLAVLSDQALSDLVSAAVDGSLGGTWLVDVWRAAVL